METKVSNINTVNLDATAGGFYQSKQTQCERGFSSTRSADDPHL